MLACRFLVTGAVLSAAALCKFRAGATFCDVAKICEDAVSVNRCAGAAQT